MIPASLRPLPRPLLPAVWSAAVIGTTLALIPLLSSPRALPILLSLAGVLFAIYLVVRPHVAVLAILVFWFFDVNVTGIKYVNVPQLIAVLLLIPLAITILRDPSLTPLRVPELRIFLAIGLVFLAAMGWSYLVHPPAPLAAVDRSWREARLLGTRLVFLVFVLYFVRTPRQIKQVIGLLTLLIVASALDAMVPVFHGHTAHRIRASTGVAENSNRLAFVAIVGLSTIWFFREFGPARWWKRLTVPLLALLPVTVLMTASRNGLLQLLVLSGLALRELRHWSPTRRLYGFLVVLAVAFVAVLAVPSAHLMRATTFDPTEVRPGQQSLRNRLTTVVAALQMTAEDPLFGVGPGNFPWRHQAYWGNPQPTHNSYLWALTSGGPVLLGLYLLLFYRVYRRLRRAEDGAPPEVLWVAKALRVNFLLFLLFTAFADFWLTEFTYLFVGLGVALDRIAAEHRAARAPTPARPGPSMVLAPSGAPTT